MSNKVEIYAEMAEWEVELSDALDDLAILNMSVANVCAMHSLSEAERLWIEGEFAEIDERIDAAEFWIAELERELAELEKSEPKDPEIEALKAELAKLDAVMEAEGVEDATAWSRWEEYECMLYALAERELGIS